MSLTDDQLVALARNGDRQAFHLLVDRHAPRLYQLAAIMMGNYNDAQDLVQETLLGAYEGLTAFEGRATVKTWLTGIMIRQASQARRKHARSHMDSLDHAHAQEPVDSRQQASGGVSQTDARLDLMTLMGSLSPEHRQVLALRELQGLSYEEIANLIGQPRGTVESRLFRARQALRELAMKSQADQTKTISASNVLSKSNPAGDTPRGDA